MADSTWPHEAELCRIRSIVSKMSGRDADEVRVVVSPYRICPLGAHIDHQGGIVSAMTINKGILLGFVPSADGEVYLRSEQFKGEVKFRLIENEYLGLRNGILDQSAILLSSHGCLTYMNCKDHQIFASEVILCFLVFPLTSYVLSNVLLVIAKKNLSSLTLIQKFMKLTRKF
ncbi:hypothetical protein CRG98_041199 [Punica granatum]|uniref:Uncharacterized protein n=1 Tax=Punica granatum TaxID=22663 RepID=A0A2I0I351_PUNGR|nr:hypothetical protein CRG98_041199 [Punica granatum]